MARKVYALNAEIRLLEMKSVEGLPQQGVWIKPLLYGEGGLLFEVHLKRGTVTPEHDHKHESLCYLIEGKVRVKIGDVVKELGPGDAFLHPKGIAHVNEVIEDAFWIEVKIPPEETWLLPE